MELDKKNMLKIGGLIAFAILFYLLMSKLGIVWDFVRTVFEIFFPIILGACIAFIINIPMRSFEKRFARLGENGIGGFFRRHRRSFSLVLALVSIVAVLTLVLCIIIPQIGVTLSELPETFSKFWDRIVDWANATPWVKQHVLPYMDLSKIDWKAIWESANDFIFSGAETVLSASVNFATSLFSAVVDAVLALFFAVYILLEKDKLLLQAKKVLYAFCKKDWVGRFLGLMKMTSETFSNFFTVQCLEACILGLLFFIAMTVLRFPYALVVSVLIAITALIPVCGAFIGCFIGAFLIIMVNPMQAVWFVIMFLILQQLENNLIYPRVVGSSVGLPAIWVLAAITVGGSMLGVAGMLIFVPLFSVLHCLLRTAVAKRLHMRHIYIDANGTVRMSERQENAEAVSEDSAATEEHMSKVSKEVPKRAREAKKQKQKKNTRRK